MICCVDWFENTVTELDNVLMQVKVNTAPCQAGWFACETNRVWGNTIPVAGEINLN